jgi:hypothetical protein
MHGRMAATAFQAVGKKWTEPIKMRTDVHLLAGESNFDLGQPFCLGAFDSQRYRLQNRLAT